jgi:hypothetical protein
MLFGMGCASQQVPKTTLKFLGLDLSSPKGYVMTNVTLSITGTNRDTTLSIGYMAAQTDSQVIAATGALGAAEINAIDNLVVHAGQIAAKSAATGGIPIPLGASAPTNTTTTIRTTSP